MGDWQRHKRTHYTSPWVFIGILVVTGLIVMAVSSAARADAIRRTHSRLVATRCWAAGVPGHHAAEMLIFNGKAAGTAVMHGWEITAVMKDGTTARRSVNVKPFRLGPWQETGGVSWFDPRRVASCTALILWGP